MIACWSKPPFSGKGSCLGFPTLTQKFTLAHGSRKPTGYEGGKKWSCALETGEKQKNVIQQNILELLGQAEFHSTGRSFKSFACFANFMKLFVVLAITKAPLIVCTAEYSES